MGVALLRRCRVRDHPGLGPALHWRTAGAHALRGFARDFQRKTRGDAASQQKRPRRKMAGSPGPKPAGTVAGLLRTTIADVTKANTGPTRRGKLWNEFQRSARRREGASSKRRRIGGVQGVPQRIAGKDNLDQFDHVVAQAFARWSSTGCCRSTERAQGFQQKKNRCLPNGHADEHHEVEVSDVVIDPDAIKRTLADGLASKGSRRIYAWLEPRLLHPSPFTRLTFNEARQQRRPGRKPKIPRDVQFHPATRWSSG